jgi:hypothetical protein
MAVVRLRNPTEGRAYYDRKIAAGKTPMEAMHTLKRQTRRWAIAAARGRAVAIRNAILAALAEDASVGGIEAAIEGVSAAGIPSAQQVLF